MKRILAATLVSVFAMPAMAQTMEHKEISKEKHKLEKPDCDKLGNFEIQDFKKCEKAEFKKDPVCTKLGNFEIQDLMMCEKLKKPEGDKLGNFEIQDLKADKAKIKDLEAEDKLGNFEIQD